jgi:D-alanyl-D-alanine carboxypeptidase/D-alanyl-D-alanine-endopeptidase (penicillin-binding protein 4)
VLGGKAKGSTQVPVSVNIQDPPMFTGTVLMETLSSAGITFNGTARRDRTIRSQLAKEDHGGWSVLAVHETPLPVALARANKDSMNLYAEAMGKRLAAEIDHTTGDWTRATAAMAAFMKHIGVADNQYSFDDCCGLSRQDNVTPQALTQVLVYDYFSPNRQTFFSSLAIAGVDGTLDDRFRGSDLRGRVFAKSGFIEGVSTLAGYVKTNDDQWYAFSIMMNGIPAKSNSAYKELQERIVTAVDSNARK